MNGSHNITLYFVGFFLTRPALNRGRRCSRDVFVVHGNHVSAYKIEVYKHAVSHRAHNQLQDLWFCGHKGAFAD
jgi:hypothetical protein